MIAALTLTSTSSDPTGKPSRTPFAFFDSLAEELKSFFRSALSHFIVNPLQVRGEVYSVDVAQIPKFLFKSFVYFPRSFCACRGEVKKFFIEIVHELVGAPGLSHPSPMVAGKAPKSAGASLQRGSPVD